MPLSDYPTAQELKDDSRLVPAQISALFSSADAQADMEEKIEEAGAEIERRILAVCSPQPFPFSDNALKVALPAYDAGQRLTRVNGFLATARKAVKLQALIYLLGSSGQLSRPYQDKADWYQKRLNMLLTSTADGTGAGGFLGELSDLSESINDAEPDTNGQGPLLTFVPATAPSYGDCGGEFGGYWC